MNIIKNRVLVLIFFVLISTSVESFAADVAVVLDDSQGMCGYLNAPEATNRYKKLLTVLQAAHTQSGLSMDVYFLSELSRPHGKAGDVIDNLINTSKITKKSCPYKATASQLDQAMAKPLGNAKITILVTDLLFDNGAGGNSSVFDNFVNAFTTIKNSDDWFNNFSGLIGITTPFDGDYWSSHGNRVHLQVERPFYLAWKANDKASFEKLFTALKEPLWQLKANDNARDVFAINLLPFTAIVPKDAEFISATPKPWFSLVKAPEFNYVKNGHRLTEVMEFIKLPKEEQAKNPQLEQSAKQLEQLSPSDCFTAQSSFEIQYTKACGRDGAREKYFYSKDLDSIEIWYPIEDDHTGFLRTFTVTQSGNTYVNGIKVNSDKDGVLFDIAGIRLANSFFSGENKESEPLAFSVQESVSMPNINNFDYSIIKNWSSDNHPCEKDCTDANNKTHQLQTIVKALVERLSANTKAVEFLNNTAKPQVIRLSMESR
jgi:hypothetical protein